MTRWRDSWWACAVIGSGVGIIVVIAAVVTLLFPDDSVPSDPPVETPWCVVQTEDDNLHRVSCEGKFDFWYFPGEGINSLKVGVSA